MPNREEVRADLEAPISNSISPPLLEGASLHSSILLEGSCGLKPDVGEWDMEIDRGGRGCPMVKNALES